MIQPTKNAGWVNRKAAAKFMGIGYSTFRQKEGEYRAKYGLVAAVDGGVNFYRVSQLDAIRERQIERGAE